METIGTPHVTMADGTAIAWSELGSGPPLVLLHGMGDSHRTWRRVAPMLADAFRVLLPDLPGHGLSGRPDAPYTPDWYARTMVAWMDAIGVAEADVVGHSFGGGVAQSMLLVSDRPRITRLALVAPGGMGKEVALSLRLAGLPAVAPVLGPAVMHVGTRVLMRIANGRGPSDPDEIARLAWMNAAPRSGRAFHRTVSACIDVFGQHQQTWHRIEEAGPLPPIALFWGEHDRVLPIHHAYDARARIEGARVVTYEGCGHFPQLHASDAFVRDLRDFLFDDEAPPARVRPVSSIVPRPRGVRASFTRAVRRVDAGVQSLWRERARARMGRIAAA